MKNQPYSWLAGFIVIFLVWLAIQACTMFDAWRKNKDAVTAHSSAVQSVQKNDTAAALAKAGFSSTESFTFQMVSSKAATATSDSSSNKKKGQK